MSRWGPRGSHTVEGHSILNPKSASICVICGFSGWDGEMGSLSPLLLRSSAPCDMKRSGLPCGFGAGAAPGVGR